MNKVYKLWDSIKCMLKQPPNASSKRRDIQLGFICPGCGLEDLTPEVTSDEAIGLLRGQLKLRCHACHAILTIRPVLRSADVDAQLLEFIQTKINSLEKWELVRFFHDTPDISDTAENITHWVNCNVRTIRSELVELAQDGVLEEKDQGDTTVYSLSQNSQVRGMLEQLIKAFEDRQFRVKAIYQIIRNMRQ